MEELLAEKFPYFLPLLDKIKDVHARYEKKKKATNSMDFDDLLEKTLSMLQAARRASRHFTGDNFSSSSSTNTRTRTRSRLT